MDPPIIHQLASVRPPALFIKGPERQDTESLASGQTFYSKSLQEELCWFPLCQGNNPDIARSFNKCTDRFDADTVKLLLLLLLLR